MSYENQPPQYGQGGYPEQQGGYSQPGEYPQQPGGYPQQGVPGLSGAGRLPQLSATGRVSDPQQQPGNGLAIASLVCGIVGLLILWFILSPLAIIFGGIGLSRANKGAKHRGQAMAGLVLGIIGLLGYIILVIFVTTNGGFVY